MMGASVGNGNSFSNGPDRDPQRDPLTGEPLNVTRWVLP